MNENQAHIEILHGVNLNMLGKRDPRHYGTLTLAELEREIRAHAEELSLRVAFFQTNSESKFIEHLHELRGVADGLIVNPGAWTHYAWAIRDALEIAEIPTIEVHLSNIKEREPWRAVSVISDLCLNSIAGKGPAGYLQALDELQAHLGR